MQRIHSNIFGNLLLYDTNIHTEIISAIYYNRLFNLLSISIIFAKIYLSFLRHVYYTVAVFLTRL